MFLKDNWRLYFVKDSSYKGSVDDIYSYEHFENVQIPTLFELEIHRNGLLPHPYESTNSWEYQKYEEYHQFYVLNFSSSKKQKYLKLHGIDTVSEIYVNGKLIGKTDNMFLPYTFLLADLKKNNELIIHILPSEIEGLKHDFASYLWAFKYNKASLYMRKSASSFGWDILPRTPLGGIYKDVELLDKLPVIKDLQIKAQNVSKKSADLLFNLEVDELDKYTYRIEGKCGRSSFVLDNQNSITLEKPKLWNIRGFGKQYLYRIKISLYLDDKLVEAKTLKYGIRKVELKRTSVVKKNGRFEFYINGKKVFLLGANWVPVDAIKHVDNERMLKALDMVTDLGCNTVRIWGGGTYETDLFYEKCDELGIFVWQDFMMGCAIYPQDEYFQNKLKEEATYIVKHLRNHCSICLWAGDNENDLAAAFWSKGPFKPNDNVLTRKILPDVIKENDNTRPYLPSSPFIDKYCEKHLQEPLSEDHIWGPRDYFKGEFYNNAQCYFTSETGYQAMNNIESLNKYLKKPWPIFEEIVKKDDTSRLISDKSRMTKEYLCHATSDVDDYESPWSYRIPLIYNQVFTLFTNEFDNLEDFVMASQISQAEALKHFIERMRRNYKRNGGIIWWNLLDGWPQPSDAVVDYYFSKKLAYYYIQRSQKDNLLMLYEEDGFLNLYCVSSDKKKHTLDYQIIDAYNDIIIDEGTVISKPRGSFVVKNVTADKKTLLVIKYKDEKGREYINHFHTNIIDIDLHKYIRGMRMYKLI